MITASIKIDNMSRDALGVIHHVLKANRLAKLFKKVTLEWSSRFSTTAGRAYYYQNRIVLGSRLFEAATKEERDNTAAHEAAHLVAFTKFLDPSHGDNFRQAMIVAGFRPFARHSINYGIQVSCACGDKLVISKNRFSRMIKGAKYKCCVCDHQIKPLC